MRRNGTEIERQRERERAKWNGRAGELINHRNLQSVSGNLLWTKTVFVNYCLSLSVFTTPLLRPPLNVRTFASSPGCAVVSSLFSVSIVCVCVHTIIETRRCTHIRCALLLLTETSQPSSTLYAECKRYFFFIFNYNTTYTRQICTTTNG